MPSTPSVADGASDDPEAMEMMPGVVAEKGGMTGSPAAAAGEEDRALPVGDAMDSDEEPQLDHGQSQVPASAAGDGLTRQSSLLSLTLDEIQNVMGEPRKNFGSMNMEDFITNILTTDDAAAVAANNISNAAATDAAAASNQSAPGTLGRQDSITVPAPLSRKTVDEVWSEISQQQQQRLVREEENTNSADIDDDIHLTPDAIGPTQRQPTFGEMTLEDFLIKAGVVRDAHPVGGGYQPLILPTNPPVIPAPCISQRAPPLHLPPQPQARHYAIPTPTAAAAYYGDGTAAFHHQSVGYVASPVSDDGFGGGQMLDGVSAGLGAAGIWGSMEMASVGPVRGGGGGSRKRGFDHAMDGGPSSSGGGGGTGGAANAAVAGGGGPVVERRQRRMIKNRESAARSRARKQAYTVELEAELNHLKEENARLQEERRRMTAKRRQMLLEAAANASDRPKIVYPAQKKIKAMRRCTSCRW